MSAKLRIYIIINYIYTVIGLQLRPTALVIIHRLVQAFKGLNSQAQDQELRSEG